MPGLSRLALPCSVLERAAADAIPPFQSDKQQGELPLRMAQVRLLVLVCKMQWDAAGDVPGNAWTPASRCMAWQGASAALDSC